MTIRFSRQNEDFRPDASLVKVGVFPGTGSSP